MRDRKLKFIAIAAAAAALAVAATWVVFVRNAALKALNDERHSPGSDVVPVEKIDLKPYAGKDVKFIQSVRSVRNLAAFQDNLFAATNGGLVKLAQDGQVLRHYTVLDGLPESDLTSVAVYHDTLFIGTRSRGLVTFDGDSFHAYRWTDRQAQTITSLTASAGDLMIGTFAGGLIKFDGANFTEIKPNGERLMRITRIAVDGPRLYFGTFDNGAWFYEDNTWSHVTSGDGLPSDRVVGIAAIDRQIYIATDLGLAVHDLSGTRSVANAPMLSDAAAFGNRLLVTKDSGEVLGFRKTLEPISERGGSKNARFDIVGDRLFQSSEQGIVEFVDGHLRPFFKPDSEPLTDNFVSSLAIDRGSDLWVGTFRTGIDVLSNTTGRSRHLGSDVVREINFLGPNADGMTVATTAGLVVIGSDLKIKPNLTTAGALPSNSVTQFTGDTVATSKGLVFLDQGKPTVLTTVQGLPSNSVYTTLQIGDKLLVGTLGGLGQVQGRRVTKTYRDSNSGLTTNWVTALCRIGDRVFIGTYGGGIFELLSSGEVRSFQAEIGKFTVNFNAMYADGERLYVGALDGARVLDLRSQGWQTIRDILPAENVMSIAGDDSAIYFGTSSGIARIEKNHFTGPQK